MSCNVAQLLADSFPDDINQVWICCIGTDRATGDSLGPFVGTMLESKGYKHIIGTIDYPLHATNMHERLMNLPEDAFVVAVDAALCTTSRVGSIGFGEGPMNPGAGVGKELASIGDVYLKGYVNTSGLFPFETIQSTRLKVVLNMAHKIVTFITEALEMKGIMNTERMIASDYDEADKRRSGNLR